MLIHNAHAAQCMLSYEHTLFVFCKGMVKWKYHTDKVHYTKECLVTNHHVDFVCKLM